MFNEIINELSKEIGDVEHENSIHVFTSGYSLMIYIPQIYDQEFKKISKFISLVAMSSDNAAYNLNKWLENANNYHDVLKEHIEIEPSYIATLLDKKLKKIINALDYELKKIVLEDDTI